MAGAASKTKAAMTSDPLWARYKGGLVKEKGPPRVDEGEVRRKAAELAASTGKGDFREVRSAARQLVFREKLAQRDAERAAQQQSTPSDQPEEEVNPFDSMSQELPPRQGRRRGDELDREEEEDREVERRRREYRREREEEEDREAERSRRGGASRSSAARPTVDRRPVSPVRPSTRVWDEELPYRTEEPPYEEEGSWRASILEGQRAHWERQVIDAQQRRDWAALRTASQYLEDVEQRITEGSRSEPTSKGKGGKSRDRPWSGKGSSKGTQDKRRRT